MEKLYRYSALLTAALLSHAAWSQQQCKIGEEKWIAGCSAGCTASWEGSNCPQTCTGTPPQGYALVNHRLISQSENNGSHAVSTMAAGQKFNYARDVKQAYSYAAQAAGKYKGKSAEAKIRSDMNNAVSEAEQFSSTHQMVRLQVDASKHGSVIDRKRGWSQHTVEMLVRCVAPADLRQQLMAKYGLVKAPAKQKKRPPSKT